MIERERKRITLSKSRDIVRNREGDRECMYVCMRERKRERE